MGRLLLFCGLGVAVSYSASRALVLPLLPLQLLRLPEREVALLPNPLGAYAGAYGSAAELWAHLRNVVLPHRMRLGRSVRLRSFPLPGNVPGAMVALLKAGALPRGMAVEEGQSSVNLYLGRKCGALPLADWGHMEQGAVVAVPVCSAGDFEAVYGLLYTVNCLMLWGNHRCGGVPMGCSDFPLRGLGRLALLPGFLLLEKADGALGDARLGAGGFLTLARSETPSTDKVGKHQYQQLYERYLPALRRRGIGGMLEIGLGCNMGYGPGRSARLWRKYFPEARVSFLEGNGQCVEKWRPSLLQRNITVFVGNQRERAPNDAMAKAAGAEGYGLLIDDGEHSNVAMRTSLGILWPAVAPGGYYVIEDMGEPAFSYLDCEALTHRQQRQNRTVLAAVAERLRPLVLRQGQPDVVMAECQLEICLLQKRV